MSIIYTIGETVFDLIYKNGKIIESKAGGSMLNASVTMSRLGCTVSYITYLGADQLGADILNFLADNGIDVTKIKTIQGQNTTLALASLNQHNNAQYSFYKMQEQSSIPVSKIAFSAADYFLFGSSFASNTQYGPQIRALISNPGSNEIPTVWYDLNVRKSLNDSSDLKLQIIENMAVAHIVKCSDEDLMAAFGSNSVDSLNGLCENKLLIITAGNNPVKFYFNSLQFEVSVPQIVPVSTIGAGDTFNAAMIWQLQRKSITHKDFNKISAVEWTAVLNNAISMSQEVCMCFENYLPLSAVEHYKKISE